MLRWQGERDSGSGSGGGGGRRVSRSSGRRSDSPITINPSSTNAISCSSRPGKMVSVPATVSSLAMDKSNNGGDGAGAEPPTAAAIKRISIKRIAGNLTMGSRTVASPRGPFQGQMSHRVFSIDLIGYGYSDKPNPRLEPNAADVFLEFICYSESPLLEELLPQVKCPILVAWGNKGSWEPNELGRAYGNFDSAEDFVVLPKGGHFPQDKAPHLMNPLVESFVERHTTPKASFPMKAI
ncbi:hypothetical protein F0562_032321 [Nyssa sinensis]|uniref:AB hydrolase-1 domain-containing protein n=1 Tax=Nyssa sinensis TaxID=561372 RepID=A0A5J5AQ16_9ASTE|nr:hypothetical protein F0562_032321 [Nyssa sinensis]